MPRKTNRSVSPPNLKESELEKAFKAVKAYAMARRDFIQEQASTGDWLVGNDNKVGAIAEFWVKLVYLREGFAIIEIPRSNNKGWDFMADKNGPQWRVSVKAITTENKKGRQVQLVKGKIRDPIKWEEVKWDELALISLDENLHPISIGICPKWAIQERHEDAGDGFNAHRAVDRQWLTAWASQDGIRFPELGNLVSRISDPKELPDNKAE